MHLMSCHINGAERTGRTKVLTRPTTDTFFYIYYRNLWRICFSGSEATICMAPVGQWRAQLPHSIPSVKGTQFSLIHTACPI